MAKESKKTEQRIILEREYTVPLRKEWLKVPEYKRATKAIKALKEFLLKHMKIYDRDPTKIKVDIILNNEIRFRGIRKPPAKIRVRAKKFEDGTVRVELIDLPTHIKYSKLREERLKTEKKAGKTEISEGTEREKEDEKKEIESKIKEETSKEESLKLSEKQAREQKHISKENKVIVPRKTLSR